MKQLGTFNSQKNKYKSRKLGKKKKIGGESFEEGEFKRRKMLVILLRIGRPQNIYVNIYFLNIQKPSSDT